MNQRQIVSYNTYLTIIFNDVKKKNDLHLIKHLLTDLSKSNVIMLDRHQEIFSKKKEDGIFQTLELIEDFTSGKYEKIKAVVSGYNQTIVKEELFSLTITNLNRCIAERDEIELEKKTKDCQESQNGKIEEIECSDAEQVERNDVDCNEEMEIEVPSWFNIDEVSPNLLNQLEIDETELNTMKSEISKIGKDENPASFKIRLPISIAENLDSLISISKLKRKQKDLEQKHASSMNSVVSYQEMEDEMREERRQNYLKFYAEGQNRLLCGVKYKSDKIIKPAIISYQFSLESFIKALNMDYDMEFRLQTQGNIKHKITECVTEMIECLNILNSNTEYQKISTYLRNLYRENSINFLVDQIYKIEIHMLTLKWIQNFSCNSQTQNFNINQNLDIGQNFGIDKQLKSEFWEQVIYVFNYIRDYSKFLKYIFKPFVMKICNDITNTYCINSRRKVDLSNSLFIEFGELITAIDTEVRKDSTISTTQPNRDHRLRTIDDMIHLYDQGLICHYNFDPNIMPGKILDLYNKNWEIIYRSKYNQLISLDFNAVGDQFPDRQISNLLHTLESLLENKSRLKIFPKLKIHKMLIEIYCLIIDRIHCHLDLDDYYDNGHKALEINIDKRIYVFDFCFSAISYNSMKYITKDIIKDYQISICNLIYVKMCEANEINTLLCSHFELGSNVGIFFNRMINYYLKYLGKTMVAPIQFYSLRDEFYEKRGDMYCQLGLWHLAENSYNICTEIQIRPKFHRVKAIQKLISDNQKLMEIENTLR